MKLSDVMQRNVEVIAPDASVREAAQKMAQRDIGVLPVCDGERVQGIVTDRDLVIRGLAAGHDPDDALVRDVMTSEIAWCSADDSVDDASRVMSEKQIQRLLVMDDDEKLVGIIGLADLTRHTPAAQRAVEGIKSPTKGTSPGDGHAVR